MVLASLTLGCLAQSQGWDDLRTLRKKYSVDVYEIDGRCFSGTIQGVTANGIVFTTDQWVQAQLVTREKAIDRKDILAIGAGHDVLFSSRSSWSDVEDVKPQHAELLHILTKAGRSLTGAPVAVSGTQLTLSVWGKKYEIRKSEIAAVDYVRQCPATSAGEYVAQEAPVLLLFSPDTWTRAAGISPKLHVRIYDMSLPEDDRKLTCRGDSWR